MARHVVIGTAGHVDHGKTALVKALTGVDTDRWEEEKRRGITIDLGFAPLSLDDGMHASVVDVPGHEDFVRNMVAGATGIDVALLVVAADEGVMPQTEEHLSIIELLDVKAGVVAISKADLAERDWLELVAADVTERLAGSSVSWEGPVMVSSVTGEGIDQLRFLLSRAASRARERARDDLFRLPVDRVFSVAGAGTVVTGTTWSGSVSVGDEVRVLPGEHRARVRSIQVHGTPQEVAEPGRRTALALVGLDKSQAQRGSVVVSDPSWRETRMLDVLVTLLPGARPLRSGSAVRLHLGTAEVLARVTPVENEIAPGAAGRPARLRLRAPVCARWGDRCVLRSVSPVTTIGGCVVVDPWPAPRPRRPLNAPELGDRDSLARLKAFALLGSRSERGIALEELPVRVGIAPKDLNAVLAKLGSAGLTVAGGRIVESGALQAAKDAVLKALGEYHRSRPMEPGMPVELLRRGVADPGLTEAALRELVDEGKVSFDSGLASLAGHLAAIPEALAPVARQIEEELKAGGYQGRPLPELEKLHGGGSVREILGYFVRQGTAVRIGQDQYYHREAAEQLVTKVTEEIAKRGEATPAQLKEPLGLSRKYLIPLLEWMDAQGYTMRQGDVRRLGPKAHP
ncbi:Selenocysteine-specific elongation factor [bacterium HR33]|nr:Selenocysteine-specific elongation factor [bacterium HR33]